MSHNTKKTARMPAMKFPKLQKRLMMSRTGKAGGAQNMNTGKAGGTKRFTGRKRPG